LKAYTIRPDSGEPFESVFLALKTIAFMYYNNNIKNVGKFNVIQGDGVNVDSITEIYEKVKPLYTAWQKKRPHMHSYEELVKCLYFGFGAGLTQKIDRDTLSCASKLGYVKFVDGRVVEWMKDPEGEVGKRSIPGVVTIKFTEPNNKIIVDVGTVKDEAVVQTPNLTDDAFGTAFLATTNKKLTCQTFYRGGKKGEVRCRNLIAERNSQKKRDDILRADSKMYQEMREYVDTAFPVTKPGTTHVRGIETLFSEALLKKYTAKESAAERAREEYKKFLTESGMKLEVEGLLET
jgi:nicotinic acid phosphoribosyltransferase